MSSRRSRSTSPQSTVSAASTSASFQEAHGFSLTYLPFIARATCLAIQAFPQVNARFDGKSLSLSPTVSLGVAVDLSHNGLVVPVVRNAEDLTVAGFAKAMRRLIDKARIEQTRSGRSFRRHLFDQQQRRLRNDFHGADHQCAAGRNSFDRRHPVEARCGVDAGRRIRCTTHDRDGRTELRPPGLRRRVFGRVSVPAEAASRDSQLGRRVRWQSMNLHAAPAQSSKSGRNNP